MNFTKSIFALAIAVSAMSAFAAGSVETYGRASPMPDAGAAAAISTGCVQGCHVSDVQGRAAPGHVQTSRPVPRGVVTVRNAEVESGYGRS